MRTNELYGEKWIRCHDGSLKRRPVRKAKRKAKRKKGYKRPPLLLHQIQSSHELITEKYCTVCDKMKSLDEFHIQMKRGHLTYRSECKICRRILDKQSRKRCAKRKLTKIRNGDVREKRLDYYKKHADKFAEYRNNFKALNPGYFIKKMREKRALSKKNQDRSLGSTIDKDCV